MHCRSLAFDVITVQDRRVSLKACEGMLLCASLDNDSTARSISYNSPFCQIMVSGVYTNRANIIQAYWMFGQQAWACCSPDRSVC